MHRIASKRNYSSKIKVDHLVVGAGVVGLAVAAKLAGRGPTILIDKNKSFGYETSSRNSEVIHAGIYYPENSLKTKMCISGRKLLYDHCSAHNVPFKRVGKWIVANNESQEEDLEIIQARARSLGVETYFQTSKSCNAIEPLVRCKSALVSPETGIIDSHSFMQSLEVKCY
jgi:2-hydroxyglutarate dehydrogenase